MIDVGAFMFVLTTVTLLLGVCLSYSFGRARGREDVLDHGWHRKEKG